MSEYWAHSGGHLLQRHLQSVAEWARQFACALDDQEVSASWAALAGLWHDLGKYRPGFQRYVRQAEDANIEHKVAGREKTHSAAGALWAMRQLNQQGWPYGHIMAYLISWHHAGWRVMKTDRHDTDLSEGTES